MQAQDVPLFRRQLRHGGLPQLLELLRLVRTLEPLLLILLAPAIRLVVLRYPRLEIRIQIDLLREHNPATLRVNRKVDEGAGDAGDDFLEGLEDEVVDEEVVDGGSLVYNDNEIGRAHV